MPRIPRKNIETTFMHIITQGINKNYIFEKEEDIMFYINLMIKLSREHNIKIIAYCIMNNHAHILLEFGQMDCLSKYMQRLNSIYGIYYNKKYDRVGYVFRDRYKSEGIYNDEHLYNCMNYIFNNPVKAGICNKPEEYKYSNYISNDWKTVSNYNFIESDEDKKNELYSQIKNFLNDNKISNNELLKDKKRLKELIIILKEVYGFSLRSIAMVLEVKREWLRKIYKE